MTPWIFGQEAWVNVIIVYMSVMIVYLSIIRNKGILKPTALLTGGFFYSLFLVYVLIKTFL
jgi:hypothetical protein